VTVSEFFTIASLILGCFFFLAGTVGLLRLPDTLCRLHALTKADNLGLGFIVFALILQSQSVLESLRLLVIWLAALLTSSTASYLIGRHTLLSRDRKDSHL